MVQRHLTMPHRFVCFTDDPKNIADGIEIRMLPASNIKGWWWKPYVFKDDHFPKGDTNLFIDLDMVIVGNINNLINYLPGRFVGLRDVGRVFRPEYRKLGSAVMKWPSGEFSDIWSEFDKDSSIIRKFHGDQDWIWHRRKNDINFYPDEWIQSYKWEIRSKSELTGVGRGAKFSSVRNPEIPPNCSVLAFHGFPHLHDVQDPVILDNWQ